MIVVPLQSIPSQTVNVTLATQVCDIHVYQRSTGLYIDLGVADAPVIGGVIAHDRNRIVRSDYLGFIGDLAFVDTQGTQDPDYTGLDARYLLIYFSPAELATSPTVVPYWTPTAPGAVAPGGAAPVPPDPTHTTITVT
jgi:hypothetical protein